MRTTTGRPQPDGAFHVDQNQNCRACSCCPCLLGAAVVGSAIAASNNDSYYYDGYRRCGWVRQFDAYGNFIGRVRTCNY
jgi:hypothetical protein